MRPVLIIGCLLLFTVAPCHAETNCLMPAREAAAQAEHLRAQLLAVPVSFEDYQFLGNAAPFEEFKLALIRTADAVMACEPPSTPASVIQQHIVRLLHANRRGRKSLPTDETDLYKPQLQIIADGLRVQVKLDNTLPTVLRVQFSFGIECGEDNILLLYTKTPSGWQDVLQWRSRNTQSINDAFGDFFDAAILPGESGAWRVAVLHGHPWCTSTISGFDVDILAPSIRPESPVIIAHRGVEYRRWEQPRFSAHGNMFTVRTDVDTGEAEEITRTGIFRYQLTSDKLQRLQPIATNGRYFVNEWLDMPWDDAIHFSDPSALAALKPAHDLYAARDADPKNFVSYKFGPVRSCQNNSKQFQVEQEEGPNGKQLPVYYLIRETGDGYQLLSATNKPDPQCGGPNLMNDRQ